MSDLILEWLRMQLGCAYLSDLPQLNGDRRYRMLLLLRSLPSDAATAEEWHELFRYLDCPHLTSPCE